MNGLQHTQKIREYCDYIDEHLLNVEKSWRILKEAMKHDKVIWDDYIFFSIDAMVKEHDISKMSPEEFIQYQRNFFPVGGKDDSGFEEAWKHHQDHNPHHWQNWARKEYYNPYEAQCHCVCMVIDWMAMGMKFDDTAQEYYEKNKEKIELPEWAVKFIYEIFEKIK